MSRQEGEQRKETAPPSSPHPQVPMYATWVATCHTHPRAHCHPRRARAGALDLNPPRRRHLLLQPQ